MNIVKSRAKNKYLALHELVIRQPRQETISNNWLIYLTDKEAEVADGLIKGFSAKQIADRMSIKERTIRFHIDNMKSKLQTKNLAHLGYILGRLYAVEKR